MDINAVNGTLPDLSPTRRRLDFGFYLNTQGRIYKIMIMPVTPYSSYPLNMNQLSGVCGFLVMLWGRGGISD